jgi:hypothetical protein
LSTSKPEFSRLEVLLRVQSGHLRVSDACVLIGLQRRQVFRLLRGLKQDGATSLLSKHRASPATIGYPLRFAPWRCRSCASGMPTSADSGSGEAGRASRLFGLARDLARLDDRRWAVARPSASSRLAASAAPAARLPGTTRWKIVIIFDHPCRTLGPGQTSREPRRNFAVRNSSTREP